MTNTSAKGQESPINRLRNLVVMSLADGSIGDRESRWLADRCAAMGFGEDELRDAMAYALGDNPSLCLPTLMTDKQALLRDLISVVAVDGQWDEREKRLLAIAAARMGFTQQSLQEWTQTMPGGRGEGPA